MKILILTLITLTCFNTFAKKGKNKYQDISKHRHDKPKKRLSRSDIMERLSVEASIYVTSADGTQLFHDVAETRAWNLNGKEKFKSTWMSDSDHFGKIALKQEWFIGPNGQLRAHIKQYDADFTSEPPTLGKLVSNKEFLITNFASFTLDLLIQGDKKTVVSFKPTLRPKKQINENTVLNFPIRGEKTVVFDSKGRIWAESVNFSGKFVTLGTFQGTIEMSFYPFKGAKEIGSAENGRIDLSINKTHKVHIMSSLPFLPEKIKSTVYGRINLKQKMKKRRSVLVRTTDRIEEMEMELKF